LVCVVGLFGFRTIPKHLRFRCLVPFIGARGSYLSAGWTDATTTTSSTDSPRRSLHSSRELTDGWRVGSECRSPNQESKGTSTSPSGRCLTSSIHFYRKLCGTCVSAAGLVIDGLDKQYGVCRYIRPVCTALDLINSPASLCSYRRIGFGNRTSGWLSSFLRLLPGIRSDETGILNIFCSSGFIDAAESSSKRPMFRVALERSPTSTSWPRTLTYACMSTPYTSSADGESDQPISLPNVSSSVLKRFVVVAPPTWIARVLEYCEL